MSVLSRNSIYTIFPYKKGSVWMFDDERRGILQEPFVAGADTLLEKLAEGNDKTTVIFSANPFPGHQYKLDYVSGEANAGTYYHSKTHEHDLWLCPVLGVYFDKSPKELFIEVRV
jgi:hypothetical protein